MTTMLMSVGYDDNGADVTRAGRNGGGWPPPTTTSSGRHQTRNKGHWIDEGSTRANGTDCQRLLHAMSFAPDHHVYTRLCARLLQADCYNRYEADTRWVDGQAGSNIIRQQWVSHDVLQWPWRIMHLTTWPSPLAGQQVKPWDIVEHFGSLCIILAHYGTLLAHYGTLWHITAH